MKALLRAIDREQQRHETRLTAIADRIRTTLLVPFCRKHKMTYVSGNGSFCFFDQAGKNYGSGYNSDEFDASPVGVEMGRLLDLLSTDVGGHSIGQYTLDVDQYD